MPTRPKTHAQRQAEQRPPEARREARGTAAERGYDYRWQRARAAFLSAHPLCRECEREGRTTPATVVDHVIPHRGDRRLFWDEGNWQPLCAPHHSRKTATGQ